MGLADLQTASFNLTASPLDSNRFGLSIARGAVGDTASIDGASIIEQFRSSDFDLTILRYSAARVDLAHGLIAPDIDVLFADSLLYFGTDALPSLTSDIPSTALVELAESDWPGVEPIVAAMFDDYGNHYSANPRMAQADILAGYLEWAQHHVKSPDCDALAVTVGDAIAALAFVVTNGSEVEISLAGTAKAFERQGHYRRLLGELEHRYAAAGAQRIVISTQSHNVGVIRAWEQARWRYLAGFNTVHLMKASLR